VYGVAPSLALQTHAAALRPALALKARVSLVKEVDAGEGVSYGLRFRADRPTVVATVPIGYADGVPWRLAGAGGEVLVGGRRRRLAGAVTMDQVMVDCGPVGGDERPVQVGDEVVLLGRQGDEEIGAWEWAGRLGTIAYEVLTGVGARVPRVYVG
jgi:alanine racemase